MTALETLDDTSAIHPIDIVEHLAQNRDWDFDRVGEDQIAMAVEGAWRTYSLTLAWSHFDETLRMIVTFEMDPPKERLNELYEVLNLTNDRCWAGAFSYWKTQSLMVYRYGLILTGAAGASTEQIDQMMHHAVKQCECYYPAFQLACWGDEDATDAMNIAIGKTYGRA